MDDIHAIVLVPTEGDPLGLLRSAAAEDPDRLAIARAAHEDGYRSGYLNAVYDIECGEPIDDDPGDSFELWLDEHEVARG